jgi:hypothetical protein
MFYGQEPGREASPFDAYHCAVMCSMPTLRLAICFIMPVTEHKGMILSPEPRC